ncbi:MAG TPA: hypothetical protein VNB22_13485 [Pyrinomonadaceae bacterium]|jgi:hypothetical protein|nr:hypothetical protein [Pyrinomonadaceae bacterium]
MKSQSLKLFAIAFVLGLVTIFASAGSANAQTLLSFETSFDFHVGKDRLAAGKYELQKMDYGKYLLRNTETRKARLVFFDIPEANKNSDEPQRISFNRYGETYFLRSIFDKPGAEGKQLIESGYEKEVRKGTANKENQLASEGTKPEKVSVNLSK